MPIRILHLEDDAADAQLVAAKLKADKVDCEIVRATGKEDFEELLGKQEFDVILADYSLPMYDGMTALKTVRETDPVVPFIMLTGTIGEAQAIESVKRGATDFVLKDELPRLAPAIRRALEEAKEKALSHEREEMFRNLAEESMAGIYIIQEGRFVYANPAFAEIFGYGRDELVSMDELSLIHPDDKELVRESMRKRLGGEVESIHYHAKGIRKDGGLIDIEVIGTKTQHRGRPSIIGTCLDITERKKAEEEKQRMDAEVQRMQKLESLRVLAGGIAHDLNNLMVAVQTNTELALRNLAPDTPEYGYVSGIEKAVGKVANLSKQILSYTGKNEPIKEAVNLNEEVKTTLNLLLASVSEKASIEYELGQDMPYLKADPQNVQQVIMNLILNAADAMDKKPGLIKLSTGIMDAGRECLDCIILGKELTEGLYAYVEVADNGSGMDEQTLQKVFEPFFTTKFTGRGLGLSAVFGIVRAHKGTIEVESKPGEGTRFKVLFPLEENVVPEKRKEEVREELLKGSGTILVVDDEIDANLMTKTVLEQAGYTVLTAYDGSEAVNIFTKESNIAAVVMDLIMPQMRGDEAALKIREVKKDANILLLSGYHDINLDQLRKGEGKTLLLEKPFKIKKLLENVHQLTA